MLEIYHLLIREIEREEGIERKRERLRKKEIKKERQGKERVKDRNWMPLKGCLRYIIC